MLKRISVIGSSAISLWILWLSLPSIASSADTSSLLRQITSEDALLVAGPGGEILYRKNETKRCIPASTLKILTALAAIHHLGKSYRFQTEFYQDTEQNLKVKGYGDPLLISEAWQDIAQGLASRLRGFKNLILDDTYFVHNTHVPGVGNSTNPYDAPNGALCANFNTVFFKQDEAGRIISAEPQTPMTPLALEKVRRLGLKGGRYTFSHDGREAVLYAGELLTHFLKETGTAFQGKIRTGVVSPQDRLIYTYRSLFTLEEALKKMLEFSNNFMANQILIALGAHVHGPPGTLEKGARVVGRYGEEVLGINDIQIVEGSGISRKNRLSALDMLSVLKAFEPHRSILTRKGNLVYKRGTLSGIKARAGYIECRAGRPYHFVIFMGSPHLDADALMADIAKSLGNGACD